MTKNYIRLSVLVHNPGRWTPEMLAETVKEHLTIRVDPDYDDDIEVEIEETA